MVRGQEGSIKGLYQQSEIPGTGCGSFNVDIQAKDFYTDPVNQQERARYLELNVT
jgi:hypothetical protein